MKNIYKVIENNDWNITESNGNHGEIGLELGKFSPSGEDFSFYIEFDGTEDDLNKEINEYYEGFNVDEHVEMWIEAKNNGVSGVPGTIRQLLEDAEAIEKMLEELSNVVESCIQYARLKQLF